jgi:nucleoside-diphosphate-sugar epimerase
MRLLILGGTQFLGRAIAAHACAMGADVVCAARGVAGAAPPGARFVKIDRDQPDGLAPLDGEHFDAVVDVSRQPGQVRAAVAALRHRARHWIYVSTVSVYSDETTIGQRAETAPLHPPTGPEIAHATAETYGPAKRACELAVGADAFICRAGLIAGPEDPTGRFTYWPLRLARGGDVLVPDRPSDLVQLIDVRDLANWIVHAAMTKLIGTFDAVGPAITRQFFLVACEEAVESRCVFRWAGRAFLEAQGVAHWSGPRSQITGETPHVYVTRRRLEEAQVLLATGHLPIVEVALAMGFSSQAHMTTAMRNVMGHSPAAYRKSRAS